MASSIILSKFCELSAFTAICSPIGQASDGLIVLIKSSLLRDLHGVLIHYVVPGRILQLYLCGPDGVCGITGLHLDSASDHVRSQQIKLLGTHRVDVPHHYLGDWNFIEHS